MAAVDLTSAGFWRSPEPFLLSETAEKVELLRCAGKGPWCLVQTSGTEGRPKWVVLTKEAFLVSAAAVNKHLQASGSDRWMVALPTHHVGGFAIYARAFLSGSGVSLYSGKWDASSFTKVGNDERATLTSLVPTQVVDLVRGGLRAPPYLRVAVVGGGGLSRELGEAARELGWPVMQSFGMTEACSQIATEPLESLRLGFDPDRLEVLSHWQLAVNETDQLVIRGQSLAAGYIVCDDRGEWHWEAIDPVLGLTTRDQVAITSQNSRQWLRFVGRDSEALKIMGELVHLGPLQRKLDVLAIDQGEAVVVPVPDERKGTALWLATTNSDGEALMAHFNAAVAAYERIDRAVRVDRIPRTELGKVKVSELVGLLTKKP